MYTTRQLANEAQRAVNKASKKAAQRRNREIVREAKSSGCVLCPERRLLCLDMHHKDEKDASIRRLVQDGASEERLCQELDKCVVLCSNCHRVVHDGKLTSKPILFFT